MTDIRAEGTVNSGMGKLRSTLGEGLGDYKMRAEGGIQQAKGAALDGFGRVVDAAERNLDKVPADMRPAAESGVRFARERPLATMGVLALGAFVLLRGLGGRRR